MHHLAAAGIPVLHLDQNPLQPFSVANYASGQLGGLYLPAYVHVL